MSSIRRVASLVWEALHEIFDESAYARFLTFNHLASSRGAYARFLEENSHAQSRRPRCC
jgi:hypothetical protein